MKKSSLLLLVLVVLGFSGSSWGACPQEPSDLGECDTLHIVPWPDDLALQQKAGPYLVRVGLYVTNDAVADSDSIAGFVLPMCYTTSNPSAYCSVSTYWNTTSALYVYPDFVRSIFRPIVTATDSIPNRMADLAADFSGRDWDQVILDLDGTSHFFLSMFAGGPPDAQWWEGHRVLLATMTFKMQDTMTVCIDTCLWLPSSRLAFVPLTTVSKIPRPGEYSTTFRTCFGLGTGVREIPGSEESRPTEFSLSQNYPNPFNPVTNFRFTLAKSAHVKIDIFNIVGQRVKTLVDEEMKAGVYAADWDGKDDKGKPVSSGVYFYRMQAGDFSDMKKMLLVK